MKVEDEDQSLILLSYLNDEYENIVDTIMFGRESLFMDEVQVDLKAQKLKDFVK